MTKTLVLVEAPSKARHIQEFLGGDYIVKASVGHVTEMPVPRDMTADEKAKYGDYAQDTAHGFEPLYRVSSDKKKVIAELRRLLKTVDELVLATDADNEGAAISWHLLQQLKPTIPTYRATWNEITDKAVRAGLTAKKRIDFKKQEPADFFGQAESALTRAQWDRLYGYGSSPYVWKTIKPGTSSGRVQTPGTRLVVEREERRLAFKSVAFYSIWGEFEGTRARLVEFEGQKVADGSKLDDEGNLAKGYMLITDDNLAAVQASLKKKKYTVGDVASKPYRRSPPPPFTTSSGLQSIGAKTRQSAKQITRHFQELYASDGAVTYIRTVSVVAAPEAIEQARQEIARLFSKALVPVSPRVYKDKGSGNSGHECIRVVLDDNTGKLVNRKFSDTKKQEVFDLIRLRFLASQAIDCTGTTWTATFTATDKQAKFSASETEIHEPGWTAIYQVDEEVGA
jgi:DNA topoisomerase-1